MKKGFAIVLILFVAGSTFLNSLMAQEIKQPYPGEPVVFFYEHANYQGNAVALAAGQRLNGWGDVLGNRKISSVKIKEGYHVYLYDKVSYTGSSQMIPANAPDLNAFNFNDKAFSVVVSSSPQINKICLQSLQSKKLVRAGVTQESLLAAVSNHTGGWESFNLVDIGNNRVVLQSVQSGKYLRAGHTSNCYVAALSDHVSRWEIFELINLGGSKYAFKSIQNGKYVRAGVTQESLLAAVSNAAGSWETFIIKQL